MATPIRQGQIWQEADKRKVRYVRVIEAGDPTVTIVTCDHEGARLPRTRVNYASRSRFGKTCGYTFVREGEAD